MAPLRSLPSLLVVAALALTGACDRSTPPPMPPDPGPVSDGVRLRYAVPEQPLEQDLELQLTQIRQGLYIEADLELRLELRLSGEGDTLRTSWAVLDISALSLDGTVEPDDADRVRTLLLEDGKGDTIGDVHGLLDATATDASPANVTRASALTSKDAPPVAGALLMTALAEQLQLPRLPTAPLVPGEPVEIEEESETVVTDAELVMPTTTVHRFTLRKIEEIEGSHIAEIELVIASVAEPEPEVEPEPGAEPAEPAAELHSRAEGTLVFDLDRSLPMSLELSGTETLRVGEREVERNLQVRATFASK